MCTFQCRQLFILKIKTKRNSLVLGKIEIRADGRNHNCHFKVFFKLLLHQKQQQRATEGFVYGFTSSSQVKKTRPSITSDSLSQTQTQTLVGNMCAKRQRGGDQSSSTDSNDEHKAICRGRGDREKLGRQVRQTHSKGHKHTLQPFS